MKNQLCEERLKNKLAEILLKNGESLDWLDGLIFKFTKKEIYVTFIHKYFADWFRQNKQLVFERITAEAGVDCKFFYPQAIPEKKESVRYTSSAEIQDCFADFFVNEKNSLALESARLIVKCCAEKSAKNFLLVICGKSGSGKTHLLNSIYNSVAPLSNSIGSAREFCSQSNAFTDIAEVSNFWIAHKLLILDDLQEIAAKDDFQDILTFYIDKGFSLDQETGRYIALAFCGQLKDLAILNSRLRSRLESGVVVELDFPDLDCRLRFLEAVNGKCKLLLNKEQMLFIANHTQQIAQIIGITRKIEIFNSKGVQIDLEDLVLAGGFADPVDWKNILKRVASRFGLSPEEILSPSRKPDRALARQIAMYICRKELGLSYPRLGKLFGGKDHSTVIHAIKKIEKLTVTDKDMHKLLKELRIKQD